MEKRNQNKKEHLVLTGNPNYIRRMFNHLKEEHPSVRRHIRIKK